MSDVRFVVPEHVLWQRTGDTMVLLDSNRGRYFELNDTACAAFLSLVECQDVTQAANRLIREFEVSERQAGNDVRALLDDLLANGLVEQVCSEP